MQVSDKKLAKKLADHNINPVPSKSLTVYDEGKLRDATFYACDFLNLLERGPVTFTSQLCLCTFEKKAIHIFDLAGLQEQCYDLSKDSTSIIEQYDKLNNRLLFFTNAFKVRIDKKGVWIIKK